MLGVITGFIDELRAAGVPVSMVEAIDGMRAVDAIEIGDRVALRETLRATLIKNQRHERAFDTAFDVYFSTVPLPDSTPVEEGTRPDLPSADGSDRAPFDIDALLDDLLQALAGLDEEAMRRGVRTAVDELAGMEPGRPVGGTYYLYRTLRRLDLADLEARLIDALTQDEELSEFDRRLLREEVEARLEQLRQEIEEEIRRRLVADRGRDAVARTLRRPLIEDIDLMHATTKDLQEMEAAIGPLTRKLAARLARRRRKRAGRLDFRRTMRKSLATGGVPVEPQFRHPRPHRPEVWLLCDISGSMATFSRFTLQFTHAMATHFSKLRSFAFVDTIDEVTDFFGAGVDFGSALLRVTTEAEVVWLDAPYPQILPGSWIVLDRPTPLPRVPEREPDSKDKLGMSSLMKHFMAGLLTYAGDITYFLAPYINSYKRFQAGTFAPTKAIWSRDNRTAGFRVCGENTKGVRVECRIGGAVLGRRHHHGIEEDRRAARELMVGVQPGAALHVHGAHFRRHDLELCARLLHRRPQGLNEPGVGAFGHQHAHLAPLERLGRLGDEAQRGRWLHVDERARRLDRLGLALHAKAGRHATCAHSDPASAAAESGGRPVSSIATRSPSIRCAR